MKTIIKKCLPKNLLFWLKKQHEKIDKCLISFFARFRWLSSLYYVLFSSEFGREHKAVLAGRVHYWRTVTQLGKSSALLRRNIHRLEKGLIMQPRRELFAESYILETVHCYEKAMATKNLCTEEKQWASDVLREYFKAVKETPLTLKARAIYLGSCRDFGESNYFPQPKSSYARSTISTEQLKTLFIQRRSVRWFLPQEVPEHFIRQAVNMASLAPSACNRQPYEFYIINNAETASNVALCAMGTAGFAENIPCIVAVVGDLSAYPAERDRHCIYIDASLAAMQFMLALETMGLSSCTINWPDIELRERQLSKKLKLDYFQRPVMLIAVGYADPNGGIPYSQKKSDALLVRMKNEI